jgi:hypothetical protein
MNQQRKHFAISGLRWTLGVIVLLESVHFAFSPSALHYFAKIGLPQWTGPALAGSEIIAALLFLAPATSLVGGYLLLFTFSIAVTVHCLQGEFDVGNLIVYGMAVIVCITHGKEEVAQVAHER